MKDPALFTILGLVLVAFAVIGVGVRNERHLESEAKFWRSMYLEAEADAKYKKCVELDRNYVICEKSAP